MNIVDKAYLFAKERHEGQFRWDGKTPFIEHPLAVKKFAVEMVTEIMSNSSIAAVANMLDDTKEIVSVVALLHDTVEDTNTTISEIEQLFGKEIANVVDLLTHKSGVEYVDYIEALSENTIASIVKMADLKHNLETTTGNKRKVYQLARLYLETNLRLQGMNEIFKLLGLSK